MAITQVIKGLAKGTQELIKKKGGAAIKASRKAPAMAKEGLAKAKNISTKATSSLKSTVKKAAETRTAQMATEGSKKIAAKIGSKIPTKAKERLSKAMEKTASVTRAGIAGSKNVMNKARDLGNIAATATKRAAVGGAGIAAAKTIKGVKKAAEAGKQFASEKPFAAGMLTQTAIDLPILVGATALAASVTTANTPKESLYKQERMNDGTFSTTYQDPNKNKVVTTKQLSSKDTDAIRSYIAVLDSIVVSDNPNGRKNEFIAVLDQLSRKYGVSSIQGKNLSIMLPS
jgi:predicted RNA-binding protein with PUA domain